MPVSRWNRRRISRASSLLDDQCPITKGGNLQASSRSHFLFRSSRTHGARAGATTRCGVARSRKAPFYTSAADARDEPRNDARIARLGEGVSRRPTCSGFLVTGLTTATHTLPCDVDFPTFCFAAAQSCRLSPTHYPLTLRSNTGKTSR